MAAVPASMSTTSRTPALEAVQPVNSANPANPDDLASTPAVLAVPDAARATLASSWVDIVGKSEKIVQQSHLEALDHVATVQPLFLPYKKVSVEGSQIATSTIAVAVSHAILTSQIDAVHATKNGWQIYTRSEEAQIELQAAGINVAGKHVPLHVAQGDGPHSSVKLILKDLPLHEVSNDHVLAEVKKTW